MEKYYREIIICLVIILFCFLFFLKPFNRHEYNQKKSKQILLKISSFRYEGQKINYLRKINPFVFEELLLDAFALNGYTIKRNKRYTNDGGIDGIIFKNNTKYLIQAKRYKGYVNLSHLKDFIQLTEKNKCKGFFCHTGKTRNSGKLIYKDNPNVEIISGTKLLSLINQLQNK